MWILLAYFLPLYKFCCRKPQWITLLKGHKLSIISVRCGKEPRLTLEKRHPWSINRQQWHTGKNGHLFSMTIERHFGSPGPHGGVSLSQRQPSIASSWRTFQSGRPVGSKYALRFTRTKWQREVPGGLVPKISKVEKLAMNKYEIMKFKCNGIKLSRRWANSFLGETN